MLQYYIDLTGRLNIPSTILLSFFYSCVPFGYIALGILLAMLISIRSDKIFIKANVMRLRVLSWCCFAVGAICIAGGIWYLPFFIISIPAIFIGIIIRVIKSVIAYGSEIKDDQDLTI